VPTFDDLDRLARSLPGVDVEVGDRPAYRVGGKLFLVHRGPRKDAVDPETGQRYDDVLAIWVADLGVKEALLADPSGAFFTTDHFNGYPAVLLRLRDLDRLTMAELTEVITDAWLSRAPKRLTKAYLAERPAAED
jgi:hypothetical protein